MTQDNTSQDISKVLAKVASAVVGKFEMNSLLNEILDTTLNTLNAEVCSIFLRKEEQPNVIECVAGAGYAKHIVGIAKYDIGEGFTGGVAESGREEKIDSPEQMQAMKLRGEIHWKQKFDSDQWKGTGGQNAFRNLLALPLKIKEEVLGVIKVENKISTPYFSDEDMAVFKTIANVIALAIENAKLNKRREEQSKIISEQSMIISEIVNTVVGRLDIKNLLEQQTINSIMRALHAEVCSVFLRDTNNPDIIRCVAGSGFAQKIVGYAEYRVSEDDGLTGLVAKRGVSFNIKSRRELLEIKQGKKGKFDDVQFESGQDQFCNLLMLPLKVNKEILGVIKVENKELSYGDFFTEEDLAVFKTVANVIALTIKNAQLYQDSEKLHKIEATHEVSKAAAGKAAHKINNQLASYDYIHHFWQKELAKIFPGKKKLYSLLEKLAITTIGLKRITGDLKRFAQPVELKKESTNINDIFKEEIHRIQSQSEIKFSVHLSDKVPHFPLDTTRLTESIRELLHNSQRAIATAKKEGMETGNVSISTELATIDSKESVRIIIEDDGIGIPKNFPLFTPFQSNNPEGTGLGLSTVKEVIEAHEGKIEYLPQSERGACFEIIIPVEKSVR